MNLLTEILDLMDDHPPKCHCCSARPPSITLSISLKRAIGSFRSSLSNAKHLVQSASDAPSRAAQRYTPSSLPSNNTSSADKPARPSSEIINAPEEGGTESSDAPQIQTGNDSMPPEEVRSLRVLFAVQGWRWSLELEPIIVPDKPWDSVFFKTLRAFHRIHRHAFLEWFSPFRFLNCKFVKVSMHQSNILPKPPLFSLPLHAHNYDS